MNLRNWLVVSVVALLVTGVSPLSARPQSDSGQATSLGDLARQLKAQRAKASQKPAKVFTNDNLPARPPGGSLTVAAQMSSESEPAKPPETGAQPPATAEAAPGGASAPEASGVHNEKYYREKMGELRSRLELHQRELSVLQRKQSQGQMQFYADPNKTLQQEYSRGDINKLNDEISKKQREIAEDEQAIQDLRDQLRREGAPPGWLR